MYSALYLIGLIAQVANAGEAVWVPPTPVGASCYLPLDVVFLQDTTGSFMDDLPNMLKQVPNIVDAVQKSNPGSFFGLMEFRDKPIPTLGETNDFCNKLTSPLSGNKQDLYDGYGTLLASGGSDLPESQLESIIDLVHNQAMGWRPLSRVASPTNATAGARVIILSTDATPHDPGDATYLNLAGLVLPDYPDTYTGHTSDELCINYEYPTDVQMKQYLNAFNTYLAILTPTDDTTCVTVNQRWHEINEDILGQPADFYQYIRGDSSNALEGVLKVLKSITQYVCDQTTTMSPTTAPLATTIPPATNPVAPTVVPTNSASTAPSTVSTLPSTMAPTPAPTSAPTPAPTSAPTPAPTSAPTSAPISASTMAPTTSPAATTISDTTVPASTTEAPTEASTEAPTTLESSPSSSAEAESTGSTGMSTDTAVSGATQSDVPTACPNPCPNPCPTPCVDPCCCGQNAKVVIKLNERPKHFAMLVDN